MDINGFSTDNTHDGTVFVFGDMNIEGNLTVGGTYPGGGGGGSVDNPMTSNLDAAEYAILNISELSAGEEGFIRTGSLDLQDNDIININEIKGNSAENKLYISANVEMLENLNMTTKNITNVNEISGEGNFLKTCSLDLQNNFITNISALTAGIDNYINTPSLHLQNNALEAVLILAMTNGLVFDSSTTLGTVGDALIVGAGGVVEYKKVIFNPVQEFVDMNNNLITNCTSIETKAISNPTGAIAITSVVNMFEDINMNYHDIFNVERLSASHASVNLNLDMIPATEGKAGQILARDPAFVPGNFATHKLVWTNQSAGGGVTNPMTANLQAAQFSIFDANLVECRGINIMASSSGIGSNSGGFAVPIYWGLALKVLGAPFYQTFNTDYITPASNLGIVIDSKAPDGITDSKITLSAPNIILNNSTNLAPSLVSITGDIQITNGSGYIHGNNLIVRGRTAGNVPTNLTLEGLTTSINSTTLNITSNANVIVGNTNFTNTVRTNFIDANSGGNISILQNLSLAVGKFLQTPQIFTDAVRSNTNTDLIIAGLLPDNKTQTNIILASPQISLNNQFEPLTGETQVNIAGNIVFNNPVSNPYIHGSNLIIRGRTPAGVATQLTIEGTTTTINSSTLNIFSSLNNNISGPTNFTKNIKVLVERSASIGVRTTLFKTFSAMPFVDLNTLTPIKINNTIANQRGSNLIPLNNFFNGDKFIIVMYGLLTTFGTGSLNIVLAVGGTQALTFNITNIASSNQPCKITVEMDCTVSGTNVNLANGTALLSMERFNSSIRFSTATAFNIVDNSLTNNTIDIYMYQSAIQTSSFTPLSYTIEQM